MCYNRVEPRISSARAFFVPSCFTIAYSVVGQRPATVESPLAELLGSWVGTHRSGLLSFISRKEPRVDEHREP